MLNWTGREKQGTVCMAIRPGVAYKSQVAGEPAVFLI